jgi:hypothetical protein
MAMQRTWRIDDAATAGRILLSLRPGNEFVFLQEPSAQTPRRANALTKTFVSRNTLKRRRGRHPRPSGILAPPRTAVSSATPGSRPSNKPFHLTPASLGCGPICANLT